MRKISNDIDTVLFTKEEIQKRVAELGHQIETDYADSDLLMIGILKGSGIFLSDLVREIDGEVGVDYIGVSSYGKGTVSSETLTMIHDLREDVRGKHLLLVEDIIDTGNTLSALKQKMIDRGAASVKICTLINKPSRRVKDVTIDYCGFEIPDVFIVGYGIDYAEHYRNLPCLVSIKPELLR